jgi:hypothetical protein
METKKVKMRKQRETSERNEAGRIIDQETELLTADEWE